MGERGNQLVPVGERGIKAIQPEEAGSIEIRNWNAIAAALESAIKSLRHRKPEDLAAALQQIEIYLQEVTGEIGESQDTLDSIPPVHPLKRFSAAIFGLIIPPLREVSRRAQQREGAERRLATLTRANDKLVQLRERVTETVDDLVEQRLHVDGQEAEYKQSQELKTQILAEQQKLASVVEALKDEIFEREEVLIEQQYIGDRDLPFRLTAASNKLMALEGICLRAGSTLKTSNRKGYSFGSIRREKVNDHARAPLNSGPQLNFNVYEETTTLKNELLRLEAHITGRINQLRSERDAVLNKKRLELLQSAGMSEAAGLLEE